MAKKMIFEGINQVPYGYSRYGWTRGNGQTWHGGIDVVGTEDKTVRMPYYTYADGRQKSITGTVTRARIVTDKTNKTWEWGYYVCVQLADNQTPDVVNFLYFCHNSKLLVQPGQKVKSGDALAIMGMTGNAATTYPHCHFEVRSTATGTGLNPTAYCACPNAVGYHGESLVAQQLKDITVLAVSPGDVTQIAELAEKLGLKYNIVNE